MLGTNAYRERPLRIYFGDWRGNGMFDSMEAYADPTSRKLSPGAILESPSLFPGLPNNSLTFASFGQAGVEEILGTRTNATRMLAANCLDATVFLNRGTRFEARALPAEAQFSPPLALA